MLPAWAPTTLVGLPSLLASDTAQIARVCDFLLRAREHVAADFVFHA
jgi:hypothetical protein